MKLKFYKFMLAKLTPLLKSQKVILATLAVFIFNLFIIIPEVQARSVDDMLWGGYQGEFESVVGLGKADPRDMIINLLRVAMSFMGIIALLLIMLAGFRWMVSGGNEDRRSEARGMLSSVVIGIIIMLASFGIINFVMESMFEVTEIGVI